VTLLRLTDLRLMQADTAGMMEVEHWEKMLVAQPAEDVCGLVLDG